MSRSLITTLLQNNAAMQVRIIGVPLDRRGLDLRIGARARDHSLPAYAAPAISVTADCCVPHCGTAMWDCNIDRESLWQPAQSRSPYKTLKPSTSGLSVYRSTSVSRAAGLTWDPRQCASPASKPNLRAAATRAGM